MFATIRFNKAGPGFGPAFYWAENCKTHLSLHPGNSPALPHVITWFGAQAIDTLSMSIY
jgi:hypothetical protein